MNTINKTNNLFNKIFFYFLWSIICAFCISLFISWYYINLLQSKTQTDYNDNLSIVSKSIDVSIQEILQSTSLLMFSKDFYDLIFFTEPTKKKQYYKISRASETLISYKTSKLIIKNTYIIDKFNNVVISNDGTSSINEFFNLRYSHEIYNMNYWLNLKPNNNEKYSILNPTKVINNINNDTFEVLPIVQFANNDMIFNNIFVVNLDKNHLVKLLEENKITKDSLLFIHDNKGNIICKTKGSANMGFEDENLLEIVQNESNENSYIFKYQNKRYLLVSYDTSIFNFSYYAIVPYLDFVKESVKDLLLPLLVFIFGMVIVIALCFLFSKRIYNPINSVTKILKENYLVGSNNEDINKNDLEFLNKSINNIIIDNKKLKNDLSIAIPYVCERYLLSIFNHNRIFPEQEVKEFLATYDFSFEYNYFVAIHTTLHFSKNFYKTYSKTEYDAVCQDTLITAKEVFSEFNMTYAFSVNNNQICIILNLKYEEKQDTILEVTEVFHQSLERDSSVVIIHSGIGQVHEGLNGLHNSYQEALRACSQIAYMTTSSVKCYESTNDLNINNYYTIEEENKLVNYLIKGDKENVQHLIKTVISKNVEKNISENALKELYLQVYNTGIRVLTMRNTSVYDLLGENYIDICSDISKISSSSIYKYIDLLLDNIIKLNKKANNKIDVVNLKQYIDDNYCKNIYLDTIAVHFNLTQNYVSKLIKKTLGVSFQNYVSSLRIAKSKELLSTTNKSISAISQEVGFNSRHPFIRKFKLLEGLTPSEYRKIYKSTDLYYKKTIV